MAQAKPAAAAAKPQAAAQPAPIATTTKAAPATGVNQIDAAKNVTKEGNKVILEGGEARVDYIKRRFGEGATRGTIAKELGVAYQIVFAATKPKKEKPAAATA